VAVGKYTVDLGQLKMSALADFEDSVTMALNGRSQITQYWTQ
jgi:3-hydroxy-3-methylglutaryl CoA synthase